MSHQGTFENANLRFLRNTPSIFLKLYITTNNIFEKFFHKVPYDFWFCPNYPVTESTKPSIQKCPNYQYFTVLLFIQKKIFFPNF